MRPRWRKSLLRGATSVAPPCISFALWVLSWTLRVRTVGIDDLRDRAVRRERLIVAFWHNRVLMMPLVAAGIPVCILNSRSRDGEIATRTARRWGIESVRGSASRGGVVGFLHLVRAYRRGYNLAVVPDGPRGPRCEVKAGVIHLARVTGAPVVPVSYAASRAKRLRSWDRLIVPAPFARVALVAGPSVRVPRDADPGQIEEFRRQIGERLNEAGRAAEQCLAP